METFFAVQWTAFCGSMLLPCVLGVIVGLVLFGVSLDDFSTAVGCFLVGALLCVIALGFSLDFLAKVAIFLVTMGVTVAVKATASPRK